MGIYTDKQIKETVNDIYEDIVFWRKNLFMLPTGSNGKKYIQEITRLMNSWTEDSPLKEIAFKAIHIMPSLLLQKPSKNSKAKEHTLALKRRLELWEQGNLHELFKEAKAIQKQLTSGNKKADILSISKRFANLMKSGNVNGALKLLTDNMSGGILPLNDETLNLLIQKHPEAKDITEDVTFIHDQIQEVHPIVFEEIDSKMIERVASKMKGGSGPSGMDADGWKKILVSKVYGQNGEDLRKAFAEVIKKICREKIDDNSLESFLACRLVPLDKNPGLRPIGIGEILRRIAGKVVMSISKNEVMTSVSQYQLCAGQEAGCEAAIHSIREIFHNEETEAVLLVDAENAFNNINRKAILRNIGIVCPKLATYVNNCYHQPARLFIIGGKEILSKEGTTQGDPLAMGMYAIGMDPLLNSLQNNVVISVAFADDLTGAGKLSELKQWWDETCKVGPTIGYYPKSSKSWLIVKDKFEAKAKEIFSDSNVNITSSGQRHLGAVIGDLEYKKKYCEDLVSGWVNELQLLSKIAEVEPHCAYTAFTSGFRNKFTYFLRTIPGIEMFLDPVEEVIRLNLIPALTGGHICTDVERDLLTLPPKLGGLGIINVKEIAEIEFKNSTLMTKELIKIINRERSTKISENDNINKEMKNKIKNGRREGNKEKLEEIRSRLNEQQQKINTANQEPGSYNWLTVIPLVEHKYYLNKEEFKDAIRLRYNWNMPRLPSTCACGSKFSVEHALSCKKGGFVTLRHNELRDITATALSEVCKDVEIEPMLIPLTGESFNNKTANRGNESRLDVSANGFWMKGQKAFFDVRVFNHNALRYGNQNLKKSLMKNEEEKKRHYNERVLEVENGTFTPLVFNVNGAMGREGICFYQRLACLIAEKRKIETSEVINWLRTKISFSLLRSMILCIRGSKTIKRKDLTSFADVDIKLTNVMSSLEN